MSSPPGDGYGNAALGYLELLDQAGVPTRWEPVQIRTEAPADIDRRSVAVGHLVGRRVRADVVAVHLAPTRVAHHVGRRGRGRLAVALTTAETDRIPPSWVRGLDPADRVVVPSDFNRQAFEASGVTAPITVVPYLSPLRLDVEPFEHEQLAGRFVFYAIGPWTTRKGLAEAVGAFVDAFDGRDDVALVVKSGTVDHRAAYDAARATQAGQAPPTVDTWWTVAQLLAGHPQAPPVLLVPEAWDDAALAGLHVRGDCLISLNRGEGFGLPVLDAARAANPVVITGWGAPVEVVTPDYPLLVDHTLVDVADDRLDTWVRAERGLRWAVVDHDDAVDRLRWVLDHSSERRSLGRALQAYAEEQFGPEPVARALLAALTP